ncbi:YggS family pyridoxal phosphate-dependent enzyme [Kytococcus sedentarius]|uniref:YggS family pyridoxal phosphate-dependent enzyme n=1 Tax=Kytococcus sedentarius TaxID=1276 RepID=UPI0035BC1E08
MRSDALALPAGADARTAELADGLRATLARIERACADAGRSPQEVTLVVVTKFFGAEDVARLVRLGVRDVGENRDQEASAKAAAWPGLLPAEERDVVDEVRMHFIGQVQSKKAGSVAGYADLVHSVDRPKLVGALDRAAQRHDRCLAVCVQVDLDPVVEGGEPDAGRGGVHPDDLLDLCAAVEQAERLELAGLMTVAPPQVEPSTAFAALARVRATVLAEHPGATMLSAGMSGDLEAAVAAGATHVRVGSAIMGARPTLG